MNYKTMVGMLYGLQDNLDEISRLSSSKGEANRYFQQRIEKVEKNVNFLKAKIQEEMTEEGKVHTHLGTVYTSKIKVPIPPDVGNDQELLDWAEKNHPETVTEKTIKVLDKKALNKLLPSEEVERLNIRWKESNDQNSEGDNEERDRGSPGPLL